jgi:hypothetical protein
MLLPYIAMPVASTPAPGQKFFTKLITIGPSTFSFPADAGWQR